MQLHHTARVQAHSSLLPAEICRWAYKTWHFISTVPLSCLAHETSRQLNSDTQMCSPYTFSPHAIHLAASLWSYLLGSFWHWPYGLSDGVNSNSHLVPQLNFWGCHKTTSILIKKYSFIMVIVYICNVYLWQYIHMHSCNTIIFQCYNVNAYKKHWWKPS